MGKLIKETGSIMYEGVPRCTKCGSVLMKKGATRFVLAGAGLDTYTYVFACTYCGNQITQEFRRSWFSRFLNRF